MIQDELSCDEMISFEEPLNNEINTGTTVGNSEFLAETFATKLIAFSSSYGGAATGNYSPSNVLGPPRVFPKHVDSGLAWCPAQTSGIEYITVGFDAPMLAKKVKIYEGLSPGYISKVSAQTDDKEEPEKWIVLWEGRTPRPNLSMTEPFTIDVGLNIRITVIKVELSMAGQWSELDAISLVGAAQPTPTKLSALGQVYLKMFNDALYTDLVLKHLKSGSELKVHKAILCSRSEYFKTIIESNMIESQTSIINIEDDVTFEVFKGVIQFIYSNYIELTKLEEVVQTYVVADQYLVSELKEQCVTKFTYYLSEENVLDLFSETKQCNAVDLQEKCYDFIVQFYPKIFLQPAFANLEKEELLTICIKLAEKYNKSNK
ncbi:hypothetical protein ABK040_007485 [Willaertia magna]